MQHANKYIGLHQNPSIVQLNEIIVQSDAQTASLLGLHVHIIFLGYSLQNKSQNKSLRIWSV